MKITKQNGFSFLELMVVIAIAGIMTAVMLVSLNEQRDKKAVEGAAREVAAVIREAQNYALTGKNLKDRTTACWFVFNWGGSSYSISNCKDQAYSLKNGVNFSTSGSISFSVPFATVTTSSNPEDISLEKNGNYYHVCVYTSGIVKEQLDAC